MDDVILGRSDISEHLWSYVTKESTVTASVRQVCVQKAKTGPERPEPLTLSLYVIETHRARVFDQIRQSSGKLHGFLLSVGNKKKQNNKKL